MTAAVALPIRSSRRGIDQHTLPSSASLGDQSCKQVRRAGALAVVADQHDGTLVQSRQAGVGQLVRMVKSKRSVGLVIDAQHLLRVLVLGPAEVALLARRRAGSVGQDRPSVDALLVQEFP